MIIKKLTNTNSSKAFEHLNIRFFKKNMYCMEYQVNLLRQSSKGSSWNIANNIQVIPVYLIKIWKDFTANRHENHKQQVSVFTSILKVLLLVKKYKLSIRREKACNKLCTTGFSAEFWEIYISNMTHYRVRFTEWVSSVESVWTELLMSLDVCHWHAYALPVIFLLSIINDRAVSLSRPGDENNR